MAKKNRTWVDKVRIFVWYKELSTKTGLSDYQLDMKYGVKLGANIKGQDRPKIFEKIRTQYNYPQPGIHNSIEEIIGLIYLDENLKEINDFFYSELWDILSAKKIDRSDLYDRFEEFVQSSNLLFSDPDNFPYHQFVHEREKSLEISLQSLSLMRRLVLLTYLAMLVDDDKIYKEFIWRMLENALDNFYVKYFGKTQLQWTCFCLTFAEIANKNIIKLEAKEFVFDLDDIGIKKRINAISQVKVLKTNWLISTST